DLAPVEPRPGESKAGLFVLVPARAPHNTDARRDEFGDAIEHEQGVQQGERLDLVGRVILHEAPCVEVAARVVEHVFDALALAHVAAVYVGNPRPVLDSGTIFLPVEPASVEPSRPTCVLGVARLYWGLLAAIRFMN